MALGGRPYCDAEVARFKNSIDRTPSKRTSEKPTKSAEREASAGRKTADLKLVHAQDAEPSALRNRTPQRRQFGKVAGGASSEPLHVDPCR